MFAAETYSSFICVSLEATQQQSCFFIHQFPSHDYHIMTNFRTCYCDNYEKHEVGVVQVCKICGKVCRISFERPEASP